MRIDIPVGNTLPDMLATGVVALVVGRLQLQAQTKTASSSQ